MGRNQRAQSFHDIDEHEASGILSDLVKESNVFLGGSSLGKGLGKAARYYMSKQTQDNKPEHLNLPGAQDLNPESDLMPLENAFYVVDIGVVVSQVYQWRRFFPRVEPFYAVKCNPDPVIIKTLALLGCNFDCASRNEIRLVHECTADLPRKPDIIFANPCKPRTHIIEAVCKGIKMMTFDNVMEVEKCAAISKNIQLILRIMTDDRGSQCRLSSKFGAPQIKWKPLLAAAKKHGLQVVGVSFHVGSGCRDASRYEAALKDARGIFDMAESEFGMKMTVLDIGGGFPGETHSIWNPAAEIDEESPEDAKIGKAIEDDKEDERFMFFTEIAEQVAPVIDSLFPVHSRVRVIGEPGRYFVAASSTLCCSVTSARNNEIDTAFELEVINDREMSRQLDNMSREEERELVRGRGMSLTAHETDDILDTIHEELADYSKLFASQQLAQQEVDIYNDRLDFFGEGFESAADMLGPPDAEQQHKRHHTVEGMSCALIAATGSMDKDGGDVSGLVTLAAAGEAAVNGMVVQAVADSAPFQDDFAYYINDGVYGAFNNIMFDHASCRPRVLKMDNKVNMTEDGGFKTLETASANSSDNGLDSSESNKLYASTVFGPTCDSIDVIARSVLLPKLKIGDWLYFENMGAYTSAAASTFNGFTPSDKLYVCGVQPEYFEALIAGPENIEEEKKDPL